MTVRFQLLSLLAVFALVGLVPQSSFAKKPTRSSKQSSNKTSKKAKDKQVIFPSRTYVRKHLTAEGFSKPFIRELLKNYELKGYEEVLRLNTILYLKKSDYHGIQVTSEAAQAVRSFCEANKAALKKAEESYKVPGEVVASLMWIESRFGQSAGDYHIPSVYLHIIQAPRTSAQKYLLSQTYRYTDTLTPEDKKEIVARTQRKAEWAMGELHALEKVYDWKWKIGKEFRGSFSGAFGMPQFLPSSYIKWARSMTPPEQPNLKVPDDAIMSIGFYLSDHGWKNEKSETRVAALMKYNNSRDYANAILALAGRLEGRATASEERTSPKKDEGATAISAAPSQD